MCVAVWSEADVEERCWRGSPPHWPAAARARLHTCTVEWAGSRSSPLSEKHRESARETEMKTGRARQVS